MRGLGWKDFTAFALIFTVVLFGIFRTPFTLYSGLIYVLVFYLVRDNLSARKPGYDFQTFAGVTLMAISPAFLFIKLGQYASPSTFHALFLLGLQIVFFKKEGSEILSIVLIGEAFIAMASKANLTKSIVGVTSRLFIDITSLLVKGFVVASRIPLEINGNIAVVRKSIIVIGSGCSGLDAFILYLLASILLIYLRKSNREETALLLAGSLGIIPLNAIRIFSLLTIGYYSGISFLKLFHSHLGDLMFLAYVYVYWWWVIKDNGRPNDFKRAKTTLDYPKFKWR